jgi:thioester reductase-like protein
MTARQGVLLTGATGLLGRYLLRDLLRAERPVVVLVRASAQHSAADRIGAIMDLMAQQTGYRLPAPVVLNGDITLPAAGLDRADQQWLARRCNAVVHAAANLSFRETPDGEPWQTNVVGTQHLLRLSAELGLVHWHHVSTAYVCGTRIGVIREDDNECGQQFHNAYERSKLAAEQTVRGCAGVCPTVFRPSVIVGDSITGYTSCYAGLYRFLALGARLADACASTAYRERRRLALRLPLHGDEPVNVVSVDWVASAIVEMLSMPRLHGRTFHLVSPAPVPSRLIHEVGAAELGLDGVELVGPAGIAQPSPIEAMFLDGMQDYWPYLAGGAVFDSRNTAAALPHLTAPVVDRSLLQRLIRFAIRDGWGRGAATRRPDDARNESRCVEYFERTFPQQARASGLARAIGLHVLVGFDIKCTGGGQWSCRWERGEFRGVERGVAATADVVYCADVPTFTAIIEGHESPQQAFFAQRVAIHGDVEMALKLMVIFEQFLRESRATDTAEVVDGAAC